MEGGSPDKGIARGWRWWARAAGLIARGTTWRVALPIALVVGSLLALVNQGAELVSGHADAATAFRLLANYAIPYLVSSIGFLSAGRGDAAADAVTDPLPLDGSGHRATVRE